MMFKIVLLTNVGGCAGDRGGGIVGNSGVPNRKARRAMAHQARTSAVGILSALVAAAGLARAKADKIAADLALSRSHSLVIAAIATEEHAVTAAAAVAAFRAYQIAAKEFEAVAKDIATPAPPLPPTPAATIKEEPFDFIGIRDDLGEITLLDATALVLTMVVVEAILVKLPVFQIARLTIPEPEPPPKGCFMLSLPPLVKAEKLAADLAAAQLKGGLLAIGSLHPLSIVADLALVRGKEDLLAIGNPSALRIAADLSVCGSAESGQGGHRSCRFSLQSAQAAAEQAEAAIKAVAATPDATIATAATIKAELLDFRGFGDSIPVINLTK
ncbi:hypothetical protein SBOR_7602 [Sclerotinia borealis F-4128]|uniref:Uncharacterized protein n=1 Tax=Sclerotinia borealis (strain F-4128) TaxID=1432307 RepID=W9CBS3_SCLBF|nr:hypothetical protein SBOR_7602 [Sclerotinia borealis F-4128]